LKLHCFSPARCPGLFMPHLIVQWSLWHNLHSFPLVLGSRPILSRPLVLLHLPCSPAVYSVDWMEHTEQFQQHSTEWMQRSNTRPISVKWLSWTPRKSRVHVLVTCLVFHELKWFRFRFCARQFQLNSFQYVSTLRNVKLNCSYSFGLKNPFNRLINTDCCPNSVTSQPVVDPCTWKSLSFSRCECKYGNIGQVQDDELCNYNWQTWLRDVGPELM